MIYLLEYNMDTRLRTQRCQHREVPQQLFFLRSSGTRINQRLERSGKVVRSAAQEVPGSAEEEAPGTAAEETLESVAAGVPSSVAVEASLSVAVEALLSVAVAALLSVAVEAPPSVAGGAAGTETALGPAAGEDSAPGATVDA
jgi:hypothetical protein